MSEPSQTVVVLGAGFTKAFVPDAPLLTDDFGNDALAKTVEHLGIARELLARERAANDGGRINLERLLTRLDGGMPYDYTFQAHEELALLLAKLKRAFLARLGSAMPESLPAGLVDFARYCIQQRAACVTFNYDDLFDRALAAAGPGLPAAPEPGWHPNTGYGFFFRPGFSTVDSRAYVYSSQSPMLLLKLHGSVNWYPKLGDPEPHAQEGMVHNETWYPGTRILPSPDTEEAASNLERDPFIVPPVLVKASLNREPILRRVWAEAYKALRGARHVVFVGYSLPFTDLAARYLFREAIPSGASIEVVNHDCNREAVLRSYREVFPGLRKDRFDFGGAKAWAHRLATGDGESARGSD